MRTILCGGVLGLFTFVVIVTTALSTHAEERNYRLPEVDLKTKIIWGSACVGPDGIGLSFGGQDQEADIGQPPTRIRTSGEWNDIASDLRSRNPLQPLHERTAALAKKQKDALAHARHIYLEGLAEDGLRKEGASIAQTQNQIGSDARQLLADLQTALPKHKGYEADRLRHVGKLLEPALQGLGELSASLPNELTPDVLAQMHTIQIALEKAAGSLGAEPPGRALSPIVFEPKSKTFVLFGGDHLDYLTNDVWVFDWAERKWTERHPAATPPPRANHKLWANGDGKIVLSGGYKYVSNTDYMGGQYADRNDGEWTYDVASNTWTGGTLAAADLREYRTGPFDPQFYLTGPKPDAAATAERLKSLSANTWVRTRPPQLPQLNRDWGTAVLDSDHDLILRFSGGHCAHGGSDVLHYHLATNRWELPFPVEFPLGQLYTNTSYPEGFNLNQRPWVTGHTYQNYGYETAIKQMLFAGQERDCFMYDPAVGDWTGRFAKPKGMAYGSCFFTITVCPTPQGLVAWTNRSDEPNVFRFDAAKHQWVEIAQVGGRVPGSCVDNSTVVFDSRRNRLLFARKDYGDNILYDGELHTLDLATGAVGRRSPKGKEAGRKITYLCQLRYDPVHDLLVVGGTLPPDETGLRRTAAYDCTGDRWISLAIKGDDPNGPEGRNVSLGLMYDAKRKLFWAVDTHSEVFALRLDPKTADVCDLN